MKVLIVSFSENVDDSLIENHSFDYFSKNNLENNKYFLNLESICNGNHNFIIKSKYNSTIKFNSFDTCIENRINMNLPTYDVEIAKAGLCELIFTGCGNSRIKVAILNDLNINVNKINDEGFLKLLDRFELVFCNNEEILRELDEVKFTSYLRFNDFNDIFDKINELTN